MPDAIGANAVHRLFGSSCAAACAYSLLRSGAARPSSVSVKRCAIQSRNRCRRSRPMAGVAPRSVSEQQRTKATRKRRRRSTRAASPIAPERSRQHTANPRCAEPTSAHGRCRSPAIRARSLQRRVRGCEPLLDVQRLLRAQWAGDVRRRRRESSSWVLTSLRAVLLDIPASRASTSLSASASMLSTSSNARSIPCSGSTVSLDALGANLGEP